MLFTVLQKDLITSLKKKEELKVSVIRFLLSALNYKKIELQKELTDEDVFNVIRKLVKQHEESIEMFKKGNRFDLVTKEEKEMAILKSYLQEELATEEIEKIVQEVINQAQDKSNFGQIMGKVMGQLGGKVEGGKVAEIVKRIINKCHSGESQNLYK